MCVCRCFSGTGLCVFFPQLVRIFQVIDFFLLGMTRHEGGQGDTGRGLYSNLATRHSLHPRYDRVTLEWLFVPFALGSNYQAEFAAGVVALCCKQTAADIVFHPI